MFATDPSCSYTRATTDLLLLLLHRDYLLHALRFPHVVRWGPILSFVMAICLSPPLMTLSLPWMHLAHVRTDTCLAYWHPHSPPTWTYNLEDRGSPLKTLQPHLMVMLSGPCYPCLFSFWMKVNLSCLHLPQVNSVILNLKKVVPIGEQVPTPLLVLNKRGMHSIW